MKLLDTNVFMYAVGSEHPYKEASTRVLSMANDRDLYANTDIEVLQEILHNFQARRKISVGLALAEKVIDAFPSPFAITLRTIQIAAGILVEHPELQSRDAIHAAVVLENKLEGIISADRGLDVIAGLVRFDPKELAA